MDDLVARAAELYERACKLDARQGCFEHRLVLGVDVAVAPLGPGDDPVAPVLVVQQLVQAHQPAGLAAGDQGQVKVVVAGLPQHRVRLGLPFHLLQVMEGGDHPRLPVVVGPLQALAQGQPLDHDA